MGLKSHPPSFLLVPFEVRAQCRRPLTHAFSPFLLGDKSTDYANFYQGLWDCTSVLSDELSFKRGDVIYILSKVRRHPKVTAAKGEHTARWLCIWMVTLGKMPIGILLGPCEQSGVHNN